MSEYIYKEKSWKIFLSYKIVIKLLRLPQVAQHLLMLQTLQIFQFACSLFQI